MCAIREQYKEGTSNTAVTWSLESSERNVKFRNVFDFRFLLRRLDDLKLAFLSKAKEILLSD